MALTKRLFANNVRTTLAGSISAVDLTITFATGAGATMPNPNNANGEYFEITLQDAATGTLNEIIAITAMTGDIGTIPSGGRGNQGTSAKAWNAGDTAFLAVTKGAMEDYVQPSSLQSGSYLYADAGGTADAITATYTPAIAALSDGMAVYVDAAYANATTTPTFSPNGLTAHTIVKNAGAALAAGDIAGAGHILHLVYRLGATQWELMNPAITVTTHGALINSTTAKTTPIDADMVGIMDSAASNVLKKLSWANLKSTLKTYFDSLYASLATTDASIKTISASVAANALTISTPANQTVNFRSSTLSDGTINSRTIASQSLVVPSGATLGTIAATQSRLAVLAIDNAGTPELAVTNIVAGKNLDESTLISTNAIATVATGTGVIAVTTGVLTISGSPTGTWQVGQIVQGAGVPAGTYITALGTGTGGAGTYQTNITTAVSSTAMTGCAGMSVYSTTARSNLPFRVLGYVESTQATAGTWATAPSTVQGCGGEAFSAFGSIGYGQTWQNLTASRALNTTYYNTTGKPIMVAVGIGNGTATSNTALLTINGVVVVGSSFTTNGTITTSVTAIIPPGASYMASGSAGTPTLQSWNELR